MGPKDFLCERGSCPAINSRMATLGTSGARALDHGWLGTKSENYGARPPLMFLRAAKSPFAHAALLEQQCSQGHGNDVRNQGLEDSDQQLNHVCLPKNRSAYFRQDRVGLRVGQGADDRPRISEPPGAGSVAALTRARLR